MRADLASGKRSRDVPMRSQDNERSVAMRFNEARRRKLRELAIRRALERRHRRASGPGRGRGRSPHVAAPFVLAGRAIVQPRPARAPFGAADDRVFRFRADAPWPSHRLALRFSCNATFRWASRPGTRALLLSPDSESSEQPAGALLVQTTNKCHARARLASASPGGAGDNQCAP
jgi:hypothetical protein